MKKYSQLFSFLFLFFLHGYSQESGTENRRNPFVLPEPGGKYKVGRYWVSFNDSLRNNRNVPVFVYYPTNKGQNSFVIPTSTWREKYMPVLQKKLGDSAGKALAFGKAVFTRKGSSPRGAKFPLILFSPGMGWSTLEYSFIIQELVSAGYIVAAVNSFPLAPVLQTPDGAFLSLPDSTDRYQLAANDLLFVLQQLRANNKQLNTVTKHVDWEKVAVFGHSVGGAAALLAAHQNHTIKASVNLDGDMLGASLVATPRGSVLFLNQIPAEFEKLSFAEMKADTARGWRYQQMGKAASFSVKARYISIAGMYHSNFQDYALLAAGVIPEAIRKFRLGPIDGHNCLQLICRTLITFFNEELKEQPAQWNTLEKTYPVLRVISIK